MVVMLSHTKLQITFSNVSELSQTHQAEEMAIAKLSAITANPASLTAKNTGVRYCVIFFYSNDESTNKKLVLKNGPVKKK